MFSQLEQIACLIQSELLPASDYGPLDDLAGAIAASVFPLDPRLGDLSPGAVGQEDLRCLLDRYLNNGKKLLRAKENAAFT